MSDEEIKLADEKTRAEIANLMAATTKLAAEVTNLAAEAAKARSETVRAEAHAAKLYRETQWYPVVVSAALVGATAAIVKYFF